MLEMTAEDEDTNSGNGRAVRATGIPLEEYSRSNTGGSGSSRHQYLLQYSEHRPFRPYTDRDDHILLIIPVLCIMYYGIRTCRIEACARSPTEAEEGGRSQSNEPRHKFKNEHPGKIQSIQFLATC